MSRDDRNGLLARLRAPFVARTALYVLGAGLQHVSGVLLLPLLVATLSSEDFTRYGLMMSVFQLLTPVLALNLFRAPGRLYFDHDRHEDRSRLLTTVLAASCVLVICGYGALIAVLQGSGWREPVFQGAPALQVALGLMSLFFIVGEFGKTVMKVRGDARFFSALGVFQSLLLLGSFALLRRLPGASMGSVVGAYLVSLGVVAAIASVYLRPHLRGGRIRRPYLRAAASFATPLLVQIVALWTVAFSGRWIGTLYVDLADLAAYVLLTFLVRVVSMMTGYIFTARLPDYGPAFAAGRYREGWNVLRHTTLLCVGVVTALYGAGYVVLFVFGFELPSGYEPTPPLFLMGTLASLFSTWAAGNVQALLSFKSTRLLAGASIVSGSVTIVLNVVLTRIGGVDGLMSALVLGFAVQAVLTARLARRRLARAEAP